jgi:hypothetical protein
MEPFSDPMVTSSKGEDSQESSPSQSSYPLGDEPRGFDAKKRTGLTVESLKTLPSEIFDKLLFKKEEVEKRIISGFAEQAIPAGIYKANGNTYYVCPEDLFKEDSIIGAMIVDFSRLTGAEIKTIKASVTYTTLYNEKFIEGLWFGMFSSTNLKRRRGKQIYELGRTCTFALIVKNMFEATDFLGPQALAKDHFFFGNNEGEVVNKVRVQFFIKTTLRSYFDDPQWGDLIYGIINHTAAHVGFDNLTSEEQDRVISDNLLPVDQLITMCYPTVTVKRGRSSIQRTRKPNPLRTSPLYTDDEMKLIASLSTSIFTEFVDLTREYESMVFSHGFKAIVSRIQRL